MIILLIGIITCITLFNIAYYEYRVVKKEKQRDIMQAYINLQLNRRYKNA